ncbi:unnamed protein product [Coregonus sp. 'balchen']|nr:unnamed protein product [Coregonus sp. 'balchen']
MNSFLSPSLSVSVCHASGEASVQNTCPSPLDDRGAKRKREAPDDDEVVEEQKLEEKKCLGLELLLPMRDHSVSPDDQSLSESDHSVSPGVPILKGSRLAYFAVFDGHGGARASRFAAEHLHHTLALKFPKAETENLDKLVKKKPAWKDGSTATCMLVVDDMAILCRMEQEMQGGDRKCVTLALSKEHNPTIYEERMRIQRAGGTVRDGRVLGVLEVSRSIGDGQYKRIGVISTPDLRRCQLTPNDRFIILGCDGLFKVFSAEEAVKYVLNVLQNGSVERKEGQTEEEGHYEAACQRLANEAVRRGCADNVTVILVSVSF